MILTNRAALMTSFFWFAERVILRLQTEGQIQEEEGEKLLALEMKETNKYGSSKEKFHCWKSLPSNEQ